MIYKKASKNRFLLKWKIWLDFSPCYHLIASGQGPVGLSLALPCLAFKFRECQVDTTKSGDLADYFADFMIQLS